MTLLNEKLFRRDEILKQQRLSLQLQSESHFIISMAAFLFLHNNLGLLRFPAIFGFPV